MDQRAVAWRRLWANPAELVELWNPPDSKTQALIGQGMHVQEWAVLPSRRDARWYVPLRPSVCAAQGLSLYWPYRPRAIWTKRALTAFMRVPWATSLWARDRLVVASPAKSVVEKLVGESTDGQPVALSFSVGVAGTYQKITVQVMDHAGNILGYTKVPDSPGGLVRVQHEADVLAALALRPELAPHLPEVRFAGTRDGVFLLLLSPGPPRGGPTSWGCLHEQFGDCLRGLAQRVRTGAELVESVATAWEKATPLADGLRQLGERALDLARGQLRTDEIECGWAHGDFAPWNTRLHSRRLFVFDWEKAAEDAPDLWDRFHFHTQVQLLLNRQRCVFPPMVPDAPRRHIPGLFALFLLEEIIESVAEQSPSLRTLQLPVFQRSLAACLA